eukprot:gene30228-37401_t
MRGGNYHYHHGMKAGENTLDALVTRELVRSMTRQGGVDVADFRSHYISFMTTPDSHNDTYAGTCHRMFFRNLRDGTSPENCPDNDAHNVDAIDALMTVPPVALAHHNSSREVRNSAIRAAIQTTRNTETVLPYAYLYADMLLLVLEGMSLSAAAQAIGAQMGLDLAAQVRRSPKLEISDPMVACYITSSFPAMLFFAHKYGDLGAETLLLASANAGGENVARGLSNAINITTLELTNNRITSLAGIGSLVSLIDLYLDDNLLTDKAELLAFEGMEAFLERRKNLKDKSLSGGALMDYTLFGLN